MKYNTNKSATFHIQNRYLQAKPTLRMSKTLILILLSLIICSCGEKNEKSTKKQKTEKTVENRPTEKKQLSEKTSIETVRAKSDTDYLKHAESFAEKVLDTNLRTHQIEIADTNKPKHTEIFLNVGLMKIDAYSNKNYPEKVKPNRYEHFTLFVATYHSEINALKTFELIKQSSKREFSDFEKTLKEFMLRVDALKIGTKPGGMIVQKGKQIFSLVETCRRVPIDGTWNDYENKLISHLADENGEEFQILNSNCGDSYYRIETRKASR